MIGVLPDPDEEFEEDATERIVSDTHEFPIINLDYSDVGGSFKALGMKTNEPSLSQYYRIFPMNRRIHIFNMTGVSDSVCHFRFL